MTKSILHPPPSLLSSPIRLVLFHHIINIGQGQDNSIENSGSISLQMMRFKSGVPTLGPVPLVQSLRALIYLV